MQSVRWPVFVYAADFAIIGLGVMVDEIPNWIGSTMFWGGLIVLVAYTVWLMLGQHQPKLSLLGAAHGRVTLDRAAELFYKGVSPSYRKWCVNQSDSPLFEHELDFFAFAILIRATELQEPVWARRSPTMDIETIENEELKQLSYLYGQGFFKKKYENDKQPSNWTDGQVRKQFVLSMAREFETVDYKPG
ncbi:MAG: hypothetical protein AAFZ91_13095 [Pseudomonadota bacterium]